MTRSPARAGCNRFPEAEAHYRPVGLAITCETSTRARPVCAHAGLGAPRTQKPDGSSSGKRRGKRGELGEECEVVGFGVRVG